MKKEDRFIEERSGSESRNASEDIVTDLIEKSLINTRPKTL